MENRRLEKISGSSFKALGSEEQTGIAGGIQPAPTVVVTTHVTFLAGNADSAPDVERD
jgi:hypothetical protein